MPGQQQALDIIRYVCYAVLTEHLRIPRQTHGGEAIVLCYYHVTEFYQIYQRKIYGRTKAVCQEMVSIPKKKRGQVRKIEFFNESALQSILEQPDGSKKTDVRNLVFMILMYDTGARVQELLDLCVGDIHMGCDSHYIILTGKGKKTRIVPIMKKTYEHLESYLIKFHPKSTTSDPLFYVVRKGNRESMSEDNVEKFVKRYGKLAREKNPDVPEHLYPHMWRHSRSMHLYRNGVPLPLVAEWLGHSNIETTIQYYANADISMKREAIQNNNKVGISGVGGR